MSRMIWLKLSVNHEIAVVSPETILQRVAGLILEILEKKILYFTKCLNLHQGNFQHQIFRNRKSSNYKD